MSEDRPTLASLRWEACKRVRSQTWKKNLKNPQFQSIGIDDMRRIIGDIYAELGIITYFVDIEDYQCIHDNGTRQSATITLRLMNARDSSDWHDTKIRCESYDPLDKGLSKLYTSAAKIFYKQEFNLTEMGDDIDKFATKDEANKVQFGINKSTDDKTKLINSKLKTKGD